MLKDTELGSHAKVQFRCSKCKKTTVVELNLRPDQTVVMSPLPSFARGDVSTSALKLPPMDPGLKLPPKANIVLTVMSGLGKGSVHKVDKPRVVLGRKGADIPLDDPEISRFHCLLEVRETHINLKDLDSTNGTFYDEERVRAAMLQDGSEFRVGGSLIRVTFEPK
jgi:FHA domain